MKFTDGNWQIRPGIHATYAGEAYQVTSDSDSLTILAPPAVIHGRGQTLGGVLFKVRLSSPKEDVIRVRISHFEGGQDIGPHFEVVEETVAAVTAVSSESLSFKAGRLEARLNRKAPWQLEFFADDRYLTRSPNRGMAYMLDQQTGAYVLDQLTLQVGEYVYGLGERFTAFVKNGQVVDIWNEDGGTNSEQAYKNVPFYMTNKGYGVFVNHSGRVSFEVGSERSQRVQFSVPGESLEYLVIYGPTPKEILAKYTALTGKPALPPPWSFGLWLSTSFTTNYGEDTVVEFVQGMKDRDIPLSVFHYDCFWMRAFHWCDFVWDPEVFPDPKGMLERMHDRGLKVCVWMNSYIAQASHLFEEGKRGGFLVKKPNGEVWQWDKWQPGMALVDFTNPEAVTWFQSKLEVLIDMGVDALKTDFGERIPTEVVYHDGSDPTLMHNYYTFLYNKAVFEVLERKKGKGEAVLFARSATAGGQLFPVHWGGDCWSDYEAMAESLRGGLSLSSSGFGFWSHDIGGFEGFPPAHLYKRWVAFGLLSSHSRLHGSGSYRVPWMYDDEATDVLRFFTKLKNSLMPYLWSTAYEAHEAGVPVMRPMFMEFPDDPACEYLDRQYMLGPSLLVAPVFSEDGTVTYYIPEGRWTRLLDDDCVVGPRWVTEKHDFMSLPVLIRPNSILVTGRNDKPDYDFTQDLVVQTTVADGDTAIFDLRDDVGGRHRIMATSESGSVKFHIPPRVRTRLKAPKP